MLDVRHIKGTAILLVLSVLAATSIASSAQSGVDAYSDAVQRQQEPVRVVLQRVGRLPKGFGSRKGLFKGSFARVDEMNGQVTGGYGFLGRVSEMGGGRTRIDVLYTDLNAITRANLGSVPSAIRIEFDKQQGEVSVSPLSEDEIDQLMRDWEG